MINFLSILSKSPELAGLINRYICVCLHCSECKTFASIIGNLDSLSGEKLNLFFFSVLPQYAEEPCLFKLTEKKHDFISEKPFLIIRHTGKWYA